MNKSTIWAIAIVLVAIIGAGFLTADRNTAEVKQVEAAVVALQDSYDFGEIDIFGGESRYHIYA